MLFRSGINISCFQEVNGIGAILSSSELLKDKFPTISGTFLHYASELIRKIIPDAESNPAKAQAVITLNAIADGAAFATVQELESFGDKLVNIASQNGPAELYTIGYIAYACTSLFGQIPYQIQDKMNRIQNKVGNYNLNESNGNQSQGPPVFTPPNQSQGPPVFTPPNQSQGPPVFTPPNQSQGPPVFTPPNQHINNEPENPSSKVASGPPKFSPMYPEFTKTNQAVNSEEYKKEKDLVKLACDAFENDNYEVAYTALIASIQQIKKNTK